MKNIRNKIIFGVISMAVFSIGIYLIILVAEKGASKDSITALNLKPKLVSQFDVGKELEKFNVNIESEKKFPAPYTLIDTYYFSLVLPDSWKAPEATNTLPLIIIDENEQIFNKRAKEIDFKTNLSINSVTLKEISLGDYVQATKTRLIQEIPNIEIVKEGQTSKSEGNVSYYMEIKSVQQDLEFNTLLFFSLGKESTVWAFSFNTLEESWSHYQNIFQQIIDSVVMKS